MQTAYRISGGYPGTVDYQRGRVNRHKQGSKPAEEKIPSTSRKRDDFLTRKLQPIAQEFYFPLSDQDEKVNLATWENLEYLYQSALNYARLMKVELPFRYRKGGNPRIHISRLLQVVDKTFPEHVNLEMSEGRLYFCLYRHHNWTERCLFWIPIEFTERLGSELKKITLEFIRRFVRHHGLNDLKDSPYYEMAQYVIDEDCSDESGATSETRKRKRLLESYEKGKIYQVLKRMKGKCFCKDLQERIENYVAISKKEEVLLKLIREGMQLITPESPHIMHYQYDWAREREPDYPPIDMEQQIMLVYSIEDEMVKEMESYINCEFQECYELSPVTRLHLTPQTEKILSPDDYPERLSNWMERFTEHINKF